jgi:hypothetical protein
MYIIICLKILLHLTFVTREKFISLIGFWCSTPLSTFQYYFCKSLKIKIIWCCIKYTSPLTRVKHTNLKGGEVLNIKLNESI